MGAIIGLSASEVSQAFKDDLLVRAANVAMDIALSNSAGADVTYRSVVAGDVLGGYAANPQATLTNGVAALAANGLSANQTPNFVVQTGYGVALTGMTFNDNPEHIKQINITVGNVPVAFIALHDCLNPVSGTGKQQIYFSDLIWAAAPMQIQVFMIADAAVGQSVASYMFDGRIAGQNGLGVQTQGYPQGPSSANKNLPVGATPVV